MARRVRFSQTGHNTIVQQGGLVTTASPFALQPGQMIECVNFELADQQGWRRSNGTERFDGRTQPHLAIYSLFDVDTQTLAASEGDTVTFPGGTAILLQDFAITDSVILLFVLDSFIILDGTALSVGGSPICETVDQTTAETSETEQEYTSLAGEAARLLIQPVPGDGLITGEWSYKGNVYAFRDDGAESKLYKESSTGWTLVVMPAQLEFDTGSAVASVNIPLPGDTVTNGVATGEIHRIQKTNDSSFTWVAGGNAAGVLTLIDITGGTFSNTDVLTFSTGATAVAVSDQAQTVRSSGGRVEADNYAFAGGQDALNMYGVDGVNRAFEFDGTYLAEIYTGLADDTPEHLFITNYQLFVSKDGTWQLSPYGNPFDKWDNIRGADEWAMGDKIVGGLSLPNGTGISFARNSISMIYINDDDGTYRIKPYTNEYGSIEWSEQNSISPIFLSDAGLTLISTTERYGDFNMSTVDEDVFDFVQSLKSDFICSTTFRNKKEYRMFFEGGTGLRLKFSKKGLVGFSVDQFPGTVRGITSSVRSDRYLTEENVEGDKVFFHTDDGYLYRMGVGDSFDGEDMTALFTLPYNHMGQRRVKKQWYDIIIEVLAEAPNVQIGVKPIYQMYSKYRKEAQPLSFQAQVAGGKWSLVDWSDFFWASISDDGDVRIRLNGVTPGLGLEIFSVGGAPYTVRSITTRFAPRGEVR